MNRLLKSIAVFSAVMRVPFKCGALCVGLGLCLGGNVRAGTLLPPEVGVGWTNGWVREWKRDVPGLEIRDTRTVLSNGLTKVVRRWTYRGEKPLPEVVLSVRYRVEGDPEVQKPFIPGVLYYGNPSNAGRKDGRVPVYAGKPGEFAIFEDHRLPMPFVVVEDPAKRTFAAIHTLPSPVLGAVHEDQWWSAGVECAEGATDIVLLSGPVGYNRRRSTVKARMTKALPYDKAYLTLHPKQIIEKTFWIQTGRAEPEVAFGFEQAVDASLGIFRPYGAERFDTMAEIARRKRDYVQTRWVENQPKGACGFLAYHPEFGMPVLAMGWVGSAETCGYALPVLDLDPSDWEKAQRSLDFLSEMAGGALAPNGLYASGWDLRKGRLTGRCGGLTCCSEGLLPVLRAIRFARKSGGRLNPAKWERFARESTDRIAKAINHPKWIKPTKGDHAFLVEPLVLAGELFGNDDCFAAAKRIAAAQEERFFGWSHVYWGVTLDSSCEDKESAQGALEGYLALHRVAKRAGDEVAARHYLRLAKHALNLFLSYLVVWAIPMPPGRLADKGFRSTGWSVVSPQNQCLDVWAVWKTPLVWQMGDLLHDERYHCLARVMYRSAGQLMDERGSLGEQILYTNYVHLDDVLYTEQKGFTIVWLEDCPKNVNRRRGDYYEAWVPLWLTAHFLDAAAQFKEMGVDLGR